MLVTSNDLITLVSFREVVLPKFPKIIHFNKTAKPSNNYFSKFINFT